MNDAQHDAIRALAIAGGAAEWQCELLDKILDLPADHRLVLNAPPTMNVSREIAMLIEQIVYPDQWLVTSNYRTDPFPL